MACVGQQRIADGDALFLLRSRDERQGGDLLQPCGTEQLPQAPFRLLARGEGTGLQRIRQVSLKPIKAHKTSHLLDQINFTLEVLPS